MSAENRHLLLESLRGGVIVSCQADATTPLGTPPVLAALAEAAQRGGAVGIRANGPENLRAICSTVTIPVIGIYKVVRPGSDVYITPTFADAQALHLSASEAEHLASYTPPAIIALDCTARDRPDGIPWQTMVKRIQTEMGTLVMADIATYEEGIAASEAGVDLVATTLSGYTAETQSRRATDGPDLELVSRLASTVRIPVICEGRIHSPEQARLACEAGAYAVVVGTAITAIDWVTHQYLQALA